MSAAELRDGRLSPGGKGLLDMRLPRATPTWMTRLDGRHMAFLKDHKVDTHVIFPAAAFVEMVLEAGVQLFEGRPFAIEDFEIRKPLILPDPPSGMVMELTYEPGERTFTIQSRFEQAASWSVHVVGSLRSERTESSFAASDWESPGAGTGAGRRWPVLRPHERSGTCVTAMSSGRSANCPPAAASRPGRVSLSEANQQAGRGVCAASRAAGRRPAGLFRRGQDRRGPPSEDETAGALRPDSVPAFPGGVQPGQRPGAAFQR